jgi:hypothetical protein
MPGYLQRVSVPLFANATAVPGLEHLITAAVRTRLQRDGRVRLGTDANSTAVLRGEIGRYELLLLATDPDDFALEYRVEVEVHIIVAEHQGGRTVLDQRLVVNTEYVVSSQMVPTDIARDRALRAVARDTGERVVSLLLDQF